MTETFQNYLKTIYELELRHGRVGTGRLATALGVSAASASEMLQKLSRHRPRLVDYAPRQGVALTPEGAREAIGIIRRHRLLETYLHRALGFELGEVHGEACTLEHHISDRMLDRMDEALGRPAFDPYGNPIPGHDGSLATLQQTSLVDLPAGARGQIARVCHYRQEILRYLCEQGIIPGALCEVVEQGPFNGPITLRIEDANGQRQTRALARELAADVFLTDPAD